jgi:hypothetical protein
VLEPVSKQPGTAQQTGLFFWVSCVSVAGTSVLLEHRGFGRGWRVRCRWRQARHGLTLAPGSIIR